MKNYNKKQKSKNIILILCFILLILISGLAVCQELLSYETKYKIITSSREYNPNILNNIQINEMNCAYDSKTNTWFFSQNLKEEGNEKLMKTGVISDNYKVSFITDKSINKIGDNSYKIDFKNRVKMLVYTDEYYFETYLQFSGLPIINIKTEQKITAEDTMVYSEIIDPYYTERDSEQYIVTNAIMHIRGNSSIGYSKKSYKYELLKNNGENRNESLLGMRKDDDWVLDALYGDPSNIRNIISCDLWNQMNSLNTAPDYDIDLECEFVELFINNQYAGIYVLKEPVNAKTIGINKDNTSAVLIKGTGYKIDYNSEETYNAINTEERSAYGVYDMKHPKESTNEELISDFGHFFDKVNPYFDKNIKITQEYLEENFVIDNLIDYSILISFTNSLDNSKIKNMFFYINENDKIIVLPWDLDMSFGLSSESGKRNEITGTGYIYAYDNFNKYYSLNNINYPEYQERLKTRYWYLRQNVLSYQNIEKTCNDYKMLLINSGAYERDRHLYYDYNIEKETNDILKWCKNRTDYLDSKVNEK